ncbi:MAG TPA: prolipoprotein diacylglyceryl transferase family protein, partial [Chryseosolibacter sp.]|nr:prolipoprotein diacylglyceryl transferase family protein [Chryseosolibacter sp.]
YLVILRKRKRFNGQLFLTYLIGYAIGRFAIEFFRGDEGRGFVFDGLMSHSQLTALAILVVAGYFYLRRLRSVTRAATENA